MGLFDAFGSFVSGLGSAISGAVGMFCDGVSLLVDGFAGIARGIADGIKGIVDSIGTEGLLLIGSIALSLIIPGFGLPELLSLIQIVDQIVKVFKLGGEDSPEELGMKAEIADRKPDDFETTEAYIKYLNEEVKLEPGAREKLSAEEKVKYGLMGAAIDIKAIQEKYHIELSPEFLKDVTTLKESKKISDEEIATYVKTFEEKGITKMQDMTDYLRDEKITTDKKEVSSAIIETMKELYPEMSEAQLEEKIEEMKEQLTTIPE